MKNDNYSHPVSDGTRALTDIKNIKKEMSLSNAFDIYKEKVYSSEFTLVSYLAPVSSTMNFTSQDGAVMLLSFMGNLLGNSICNISVELNGVIIFRERFISLKQISFTLFAECQQQNTLKISLRSVNENTMNCFVMLKGEFEKLVKPKCFCLGAEGKTYVFKAQNDYHLCKVYADMYDLTYLYELEEYTINNLITAGNPCTVSQNKVTHATVSYLTERQSQLYVSSSEDNFATESQVYNQSTNTACFMPVLSSDDYRYAIIAQRNDVLRLINVNANLTSTNTVLTNKLKIKINDVFSVNYVINSNFLYSAIVIKSDNDNCYLLFNNSLDSYSELFFDENRLIYLGKAERVEAYLNDFELTVFLSRKGRVVENSYVINDHVGGGHYLYATDKKFHRNCEQAFLVGDKKLVKSNNAVSYYYG